MAAGDHDGRYSVAHGLQRQCGRRYDAIVADLDTHSLRRRCAGRRNQRAAGATVDGDGETMDSMAILHYLQKCRSEDAAGLVSELLDQATDTAGAE